MQLENLINLNQFDYQDKQMMLEHHSYIIDRGIKSLVDAINSINMLCTINSCQGTLIEEEVTEHCPFTYVDFYVLYHQYHIAHQLCTKLIHEFGNVLSCRVEYEADYDLDKHNDEGVDNGLINIRFRIEIVDASNLIDNDRIYNEVVDSIKDFNTKLR